MPAAPVPLRFSETARSGTRMLMAMAVVLEGKDREGNDFKESTQTVVINRTGAKVMAATPLAMGLKMNLSVGSGLLLQILPTGERTPGQKVAFDKAERSFYASGTIRIADLMGHELKTETLAERSHLGHRHHLAPGAAQHHHMRVIDHHAGRAA